MAIQLRRGNQADLDMTQLLPGELAVCLDTGKVIVMLTGGNYLTLTDTPELRAIVDGKAPALHSHALADVTGLAAALDRKQNTLVAGTNITLTPNSGDGTVIIAAEAQANAKPDWNAAAGSAAEILNKPTIPTIVTLTQAQYEALDPPDAGTIYLILEAST